MKEMQPRSCGDTELRRPGDFLYRRRLTGAFTMPKLRLMTVVGTRPEIIKMSAIIKKCDKYFDHILVHTGQNYDYTLNKISLRSLVLENRIIIWAL